MRMRRAERGVDDALVWELIRAAVESGEVFCADPEGGMAGGLAYFWPEGAEVWIAEDEAPLGCFYLKANQPGNGAHVCNAGYCVPPEAAGRGVARAMLAFSLEEAARRGFRAMQYNCVVATNVRAVATWEKAGFEIVGRLPGAFRHPREGYVDALVMFRGLESGGAVSK